ncbi:aldehyde dehydrogenase (NAD+) [Erythrobacter litoralis]|jgi:aldehyde dehydrogenase (NAD+)|uniref:Aldehyde dehydrogenase n=1 Tax=Erythrobacter litoralis TaxID=39960 RepID=A0A074NGF2_9SPHN|nr:aldehyde dehydrogenase family protein [Erythrobacter litoralis]AOL24714.1 aldehyde dehydrogenase (NAD+) [Erythrobacter litoralis]KEO96692.1 aldehyde dehydrogenase [Erythrobacter litoralis]MEE4338702.1 aldehyde dehydrogenase family protein [Erythrobacter sp.]
MAKQYRNLINGEMIETGEWLDVVNPANEEVIGQVPACGQDELDKAVAAARAAFKTWRKTPIDERRAAIMAISGAIKENADELFRLLTSEQGKPHNQAQQEIYGAAAMSAAQSTLSLEDEINEDSDARLSRTRRVPVGVVGGIVPWNFPVMMAIQKIVPAMLSGCTIILKPSPFTPLTTLRIAELIADKVPAGVVNIITGEDDLGPMITAHPDIDKITFTGSTATGKKIMEGASADLKRITLELGGNDASIVLPDADPKKVAEQLFWSSFSNAGQICIAAKRVYIHEDIYDELSAAIVEYAKNVKVGDGAQQGTGVGPIQNKKQYERVLELIEDAKDKGYKFLLGGDKDPSGTGYFVPLTILDNPPEDARIVAEEQFGPVMPLMKFKTEEEVIAKANNSEYGLAGAVWTANPDKGVEIAEQLETGTVWVNEFLHLSPFAPFGGHKQSGFGAEYGKEGLKEFTYPQVITVKKDNVPA